MPHKDPEQRRTYWAEYNRTHKEQNAARKKAYAQKNKDRLAAYNKAYWQADPEGRRAFHAKHRRTLKGRYTAAKASAKKRNYRFDLSFDEFQELLKDGICHYCRQELNPTGSALDRMNEEPYYTVANTVPCCQRCNSTFLAHYTYEEKLILAKAIQEIDRRRNSKALAIIG